MRQVFRYRHFAVLCLLVFTAGCSGNKDPVASPETDVQLLPVNPARAFSDEKFSDLCAEIALGFSEEEQLMVLRGKQDAAFEPIARGACKCLENEIGLLVETHGQSDPAFNETRVRLLKAHMLFGSALMSPSYRTAHLDDIQELNDELFRRLALEFPSPEEGVTYMHHMVKLAEDQKNVDGCFE
nr:hypothetical protein [uncultured Hyphomonas sp.]